jgi:small subunit ribosomal protein S17
MTTQAKKNQQPLTGKVVGTKMLKTVVVEVTDIIKNATYNKYMKLDRRMLAHDEESVCKLDDIVLISQVRPYSKRKAWKVEKIIK